MSTQLVMEKKSDDEEGQVRSRSFFAAGEENIIFFHHLCVCVCVRLKISVMKPLPGGTGLWNRGRSCAGRPGMREKAAGVLQGGNTLTHNENLSGVVSLVFSDRVRRLLDSS